jgi:transglutaminase-like putative cysteine protease
MIPVSTIPARSALSPSLGARVVRPGPWIGAAILFLLSISPVHAQFQQPSADELSMTADPKAPGAAAVYLYYEEAADSQAKTSSRYERIKVLTEHGKELATVSIPYERGVDKVASIEGRTIHADGTVIPLTVKPSDLTEFKTKGYQLNSVVFTLPDVQVGSILEYRIKTRRDEDMTYLPAWQVQRKYFVHNAHYSFHPSAYQTLMSSSHLGPNAKVVKGKKDLVTLDITDVPPEPDDDWMPPLNTIRWRVDFFNNIFPTSDAFWQSKRDRWAAWINNFIEPTGAIKKAVAEIIADDDTDQQKAEKLYRAVQKLDNTDFSRKKSEAERKQEKLKEINKADDVWKNQSGSSDEIALLYASMARAAGLKVWPGYIVNRDRAIFDIGYLSDSQFDNDIVIVELNGKEVDLDPGQKMCPFGTLHWKHTLASGFRLTDKGASFLTTPPIEYKNSSISRVASLHVDDTGNVKGKVQIVMSGPEALFWRQLALQNDEDEVRKQFIEAMQSHFPEGAQADFDHFLALQEYESNLIATINVSGNIGTATGKHFFLPGLFFQSRAIHPFVAQDKRTIPIDVHYPLLEEDQVTYFLPPGFNVESMPQDGKSNWPGRAVLSIGSTPKNGIVTVQRAMARNFTLLPATEYPDLHAFFQKIATADQQQLVLTRATTAQGN